MFVSPTMITNVIGMQRSEARAALTDLSIGLSGLDDLRLQGLLVANQHCVALALLLPVTGEACSRFFSLDS